ncbi:MAG TPA: dehydratase, partial [Pseudonocardia sp.]
NKVRFPSPVPVGSRVRGSYEFVDVSEVKDAVQITTKVTIELEGSERPACVAETITRIYL